MQAKSIHEVDLPDGTYIGRWVGHQVKIRGQKPFMTDIALRNTALNPAKVFVEVSNRIATVRTADKPKSHHRKGAFGEGTDFGFNANQYMGNAGQYLYPPPIIIHTGGSGYGTTVSFDGGFTRQIEQDFY